MRPEQIRSLDDLRRLPFTRKSDLRDHYPFGLFAVPREEVVRIHGSSGTTGKPTVVGYTRADIDLFAEVCARCLALLGAEPGMMLHNAFGYGLFTGGLGFHYGGERLGMTVVPVSGGMTERQLLLIEDFRPDVIACTPSYALTLAQAFKDRGIAPEDISLRFAAVGAEPWTETMRSEIDRGLGVRTCNIYGLSEVIGPGVAGECVEERDGSHVHEDHFLPEVVDPDSGEPLAEGEVGVLVFTALTKQALPLMRYWTGDLASLSSEPCSCGRTLIRMSAIRGRTDDMLIIRGVNVFPTQVEEVIGRVPELSPHYQLVVSRERHDGRGRGAHRGDRRALPLGRERAALGRGDRGRSHAARAARARLRDDQGHDRLLHEGQRHRPRLAAALGGRQAPARARQAAAGPRMTRVQTRPDARLGGVSARQHRVDLRRAHRRLPPAAASSPSSSMRRRSAFPSTSRAAPPSTPSASCCRRTSGDSRSRRASSSATCSRCPRAGFHLMHSMAQPTAAALALRADFERDGKADLGPIRVDRAGDIGTVTIQNHAFLNSEDDASTAALEVAVDLVLLDDAIRVGVLRGAPATHPKYAGRRILGSGINLTHLYHGKISLLEFLLERELGQVTKFYRGHDLAPAEGAPLEHRREKPWIAAVDSFAIGGACQWLLVMDRVIAETGSYFVLPARKEGIIPGCANLRLARIVGERAARQALFFGRSFPCDSPGGQLLADEVVETGDMERAIASAAAELTSAGETSLVANRQALRKAQEPLDLFRRYMADYCYQQALCLYSPALIDNLERNWNAKQRTL